MNEPLDAAAEEHAFPLSKNRWVLMCDSKSERPETYSGPALLASTIVFVLTG